MKHGQQPHEHSPPIPPVHLSLASPAFAFVRIGQAVAAVLLAGCLGFIVWCWLESRALQAEAAHYAESLARVQDVNRQSAAQMSREGLTLSEAQISQVYRRVEFANRLSEKRAFSWTRLLSDLETALPPRVSIRSVQLKFQDSSVKLQGMVLTLRDLNALVDSLEQHGAFRHVKVSSHGFQEMREIASKSNSRRAFAAARRGNKRSQQVVSFGLTVTYRPAG